MSDSDWQNGYSAGYQNGFEAGYNKGKSEGQSPYSPKPDWLRTKIGTTCSVCGMFFEAGKAYGYVCPHSGCPSKVTCITPLTTGVTPGSCVSTTTAATWTSQASGKPLSDNGQWGSWMTGRPMTANTQALSIPVNNTPDGLSYEEIYGSVVYQQGRKTT